MSDESHSMEFVTTEELIEELKKRHDSVLFVGIVNRASDADQYNLQWRGGTATAVGLARYAEQRILRRLSEDKENA